MTDSVVDVVIEPTPISAAPSYFAPPAAWTPVDYRFWDDGSLTHLIAEVDPAGLTNGAIAWMAAPDRLIGELVRMLAPRVRVWNVGRLDFETGSWVPAPGPEELGERAFYDPGIVTGTIVLACRAALIEVTAARTGLAKKGPTPSESGPGTTNGNASEPGSGTTKTATRSRKASTSA